ncbi:MAG TPA: hypothetical protein VFO65_00020 [Acidimicrobiales bacterium]|nr:hypothetical protein [Acidimicrobiales bacterium]
MTTVMDPPDLALRAAASGAEESVYTPDPAALVRSLEANSRFRRDTTLGGILHRGKISFREISPVDSLHVTIKGNRVSAHVDRICPLSFRERTWARQYSLARVVAHNVVGLVGDVGRRLRRIGGAHRCQLECEVVWVDDEAVGDLVAGIQASDPGAGHDHAPGSG